jgi:hypothetical protein
MGRISEALRALTPSNGRSVSRGVTVGDNATGIKCATVEQCQREVVESPSAKFAWQPPDIVHARHSYYSYSYWVRRPCRPTPKLDWIQSTSCQPPRGYSITLTYHHGCVRVLSYYQSAPRKFLFIFYICRDISVEIVATRLIKPPVAIAT